MFGQNNNEDQNQWQPASNPTEPAIAEPTATPTEDTSAPLPVEEPVSSLPSSIPTAPVSTSSTAPSTNDDLLQIKQEALQQLSPLVGHLDQTPEEKFRTTMMMIQAADDQSMLGSAYEAAKQITDEKARAQALLDVINEINYFTQQHKEA